MIGPQIQMAGESGPGKLRRRLGKRHAALLDARSSWDEHNKEISEHVLPRRLRLSTSEVNQGTKKNGKIINSTATKALRTLGAGMHAGMTSPSRPWHTLSVGDPALGEMAAVKVILQQIVERQRMVFNRSNFYNALAQFYEDLAAHGTAVMWIDEDDEKTIRCHVLPWGSYCLALDARNRPATLFRDVPMSVGQIMERGWLARATERVRNLAEEERWDEMIDVVHVVEKRIDRDITKADGLNMAYASYWYEKSAPADHGFLKVWGYEECPFVAARWNVTGDDTYGTGPSHDALGDVKGLQTLELEKAKAAAMIVKPPMKGPNSMRGGPGGPSIVPGTMNFLDTASGGATFEPAVKVDTSAVREFRESIKEHEVRIKEMYFADLWLMLAASDRREITAREVDERHEEKMLQLGPVLVRLHDELLDPALDRIYAIMLRKGMFADLFANAPQELRGVELRVEYISILAQAQKLLSGSAVERFIAFVGNIASVRPDVLDRINWDEMIRHYGDILGIKPDLLLPDSVVEKIREAKQRLEAANQAMQERIADAEVQKKLASADMSGDNALTRLHERMTQMAPDRQEAA